ncbi:MAG: methyltransferase domain-containing protein [Spirochaetales bacterium]|nr:methyltransferase domain-containing protein [Spirochaetales bacterium]
MQEIIVPYLQCPECNGAIIISGIIEKKLINTEEFITKGLLHCNQCHTSFPVIDGIPRLLRKKELTPAELQCTEEFSAISTAGISSISTAGIIVKKEKTFNEKEKLALMEKKVRQLFRPEKAVSHSMMKRIEHDLEYRVYHSDKKEKYVETAKLYYKGDMQSILEVGGGQGGTLSCFRKYFHPRITLSIDIDPVMSEVCQIRDPFINVIRADGTNIPVKDNCIDFIITTATLEHIKEWKICLREIARISRNAFISYSPNKWFGYDWGHVDGPVIPFLPKNYSLPLLCLWHKLRGTGRDYKALKRSLSGTFYISRYNAVKELRKYGTVINVFENFLEYSIRSDYHYMGGSFKKFLLKHTLIRKIMIALLLAFKVEPMVYLFLKKKPVIQK